MTPAELKAELEKAHPAWAFSHHAVIESDTEFNSLVAYHAERDAVFHVTWQVEPQHTADFITEILEYVRTRINQRIEEIQREPVRT